MKAKIYLAIAAAILGLDFTAGFKVASWRLGGTIERLTAQAEKGKEYLTQLTTATEEMELLRGAVDSTNTQIENWKSQAQSLQEANRKATEKIIRLEAERGVQVPVQPYPQDCEAAVRELARRLGARP